MEEKKQNNGINERGVSLSDIDKPEESAKKQENKNKRRRPAAKKNNQMSQASASAGMAEKETKKETPKRGIRSKNTNKDQAPNPSAGGNPPAPLTKQGISSRASGGTKSKETSLKIIPLGGMGEIGKNMTAIQYGNNIIVIDGGVMFPEDELLGIDMVMPDYTYLKENKDIVRAFFLSHGHEDHIGAMPYILKDLTMPVYSFRLTLGLLQGKLTEQRVKADLREVSPRQKIKAGPFEVEFIRVSHSIPDSMALAIHTPVGTILSVSDFKMDMSPIDGQLMDFGLLARLGEEGVLLLMMDSTNVEREGFTPSEKTVGEVLDNIFLDAKGRIILTSFASNIHRIQQAIWSAERSRRKVVVLGRSMQNVFAIAKELGYLSIPDNIVVSIDEANNLPADQVLILTTGSQGEPLSGLTRMSTGAHKQVHIMPGDLVVISATPIPGNERLVGRTIDNLFRQGASVIHERSEGIHVSGHASKEELKMLFNIVKPKFFLPMHGEYRMLYKNALLAQEVGIPSENTFVLENGQVLEVSRRRCHVNGSVPCGRILIDGLGIGDVGNTVLKERKLLSEGGIIIVNIVLSSKKPGKILYGPEIFSRGFIFEKEYEHIIDEARKKVASICTKEMLSEGDLNVARAQIRSSLSRFLVDRIGRKPIVLPILTEV